MTTLGKRLEASRVEAGLGLREWCRDVTKAGHKITHSMVRRYELDQTIPPADYVIAVCEWRDINPVWLLDGSGRRRWGKDAEARWDRLAAASWMRQLAGQLEQDVENYGAEVKESRIEPSDLTTETPSQLRGAGRVSEN